MVKSMFAGVAGLKAHQSKMDVIGNNIANVNTWGYKAGSANFMDAIYMTMSNGNGGVTTNGGYGGTNPSQVGYGANLGSISYDFTKGGYSYSSRGLDCMIDGPGFFIVGTKTNAAIDLDKVGDSCQLSRVGMFYVDNNGYLTDASGNYIYGWNAVVGTDANGKPEVTTKVPDSTSTNIPGVSPIRIPWDDTTTPPGPLFDITSYSLESDGSIVATTSTNDTFVFGKVAIASVQNPNGLAKQEGYYYKPTNNSGKVTAVLPGGNTGRITGNALEMANVDLANEFANMITTQRGFQANSKIITVTDEMLQELVNMKR